MNFRMEHEMKIFVAGHRGMVGSAVVRRLTRSGYQNLILRTRDELDLTDQAAVADFFQKEKPECVIVAAARVGGIVANMTQQADFLYENLMIQSNIIWSAHRYEARKLIFLGSSCIYPRDCPQPIKEEYFLTGKLEATNEGYAIAKIAGIELCQKIYEQYGRKFVSCMPTNLYGENDNFHPEHSHVIPGLIQKIYDAMVHSEPRVTLWGTGSPLREFLYVDDLADAIIFLMERYDGKDFLNIGTGQEITIRDLAGLISELMGFKGELVFDATRPDGTPRKLLDSSRIHALGWNHTTSLREGLRKTIDYYRTHVAQ